jgi:hypothetical protein
MKITSKVRRLSEIWFKPTTRIFFDFNQDSFFISENFINPKSRFILLAFDQFWKKKLGFFLMLRFKRLVCGG